MPTRRLAPVLLAALIAGCGSGPSDDVLEGDDDAEQPEVDAAAPPCPVGEPSSDLVVATTRGLVQGDREGGVRAFRGVPFAAPPTGPGRFRPPAPHPCWAGERDARTYGPICPQKGLPGLTGEEDCLTLNVWTPAAAGDSLPVLFWIHGGANVLGSADQDAGGGNLYDGQFLADRHGVVVVTANYRLGALGFLAHPALGAENARGVSGNYGLLDQIAALGWVADNVARFGGDPDRVLLFGESAGAFDACALLASPLASGLFSAALLQSGVCAEPDLATREAAGGALVESLGCGGAPDPAACLRGLDPAALTAADPTDLFMFGADMPPIDFAHFTDMAFGPTVDGWVLPESPIRAIARGHHNRVPIVVGTNANEGDLFVLPGTMATCGAYRDRLRQAFGDLRAAEVEDLYPCQPLVPHRAFADAFTDLVFTCSARRVARAARASQDEPVYRYVFTHTRVLGPLAALRAFHAAEVPFVFRTLGRLGDPFVSSELELADEMGAMWTALARTGQPGAPWQPYDADRDDALELATGDLAMIDGVRSERCDFWDTLADE